MTFLTVTVGSSLKMDWPTVATQVVYLIAFYTAHGVDYRKRG